MKKYIFWEQLIFELQKQASALLHIVGESKGSSPGRAGFKMAVFPDGKSFGSIGGGKMEFECIETSRTQLQEAKLSPKIQRLIHTDENIPGATGMVCEGEQTLISYPLSKSDIPTLMAIKNIVENHEVAKLSLNEDHFSLIKEKRNTQSINFQIKNKQWTYEENIGRVNTIYILGGGHVALALSEVLAKLDFYSIIIDDRPGLKLLEDNSFANEKITLPYSEISNIIPAEDESKFLVIMTYSHLGDADVLYELVGMKYRYLGMMGSAKKVAEIYKRLEKRGIEKSLLRKVHSPIGVSIYSETPEEIAISIAAELIKVKNQKN